MPLFEDGSRDGVTWRVTDHSLGLSGKGSSPEDALGNLKAKIRTLTCRASRSYSAIAAKM
jgi:hypothetical protein